MMDARRNPLVGNMRAYMSKIEIFVNATAVTYMHSKAMSNCSSVSKFCTVCFQLFWSCDPVSYLPDHHNLLYWEQGSVDTHTKVNHY